jgi:tripartite-type tricarboxylate transporter receptor subunit TctC
LGGQIQIGMSSKAVLLPLIKEGRLRAVAVTSEARWPELPDVPTMAESGITGMPAHIWFGLLAPARFQWKAAAFARWHEPDDARVSSPDL